MVYAVLDIETTGKRVGQARITEICVVRMEEDKVINKFVSLINPQMPIPKFITQLTGIDDDMVRSAPNFEEVAERIVEITENAVVVAHNVNFDYPILRSEFKYLGYNFKRKKLCTVRLAKRLMPGKFSYSLGRLCSSLGIPLVNRHRAEGDTDATVILFQRLMQLDSDGIIFDSFLNSRKTFLRSNVDRETFAKLPQRPGVYFFKNSENKIIYVGKAIRIKERVLSHFYSKSESERSLCAATNDIDFIETGNELVALLMEAEEIQKHLPEFNSVQKKSRIPYCIVHYTNQKGIIQLALDRKSALDLGVRPFQRREGAIEKLTELCKEFDLCPKYSGLQRIKGGCGHPANLDCSGVCRGMEDIEEYNRRAKSAIAALSDSRRNYAIVENGRSREELAFVLVRDGSYQGYGFYNHDDFVQGFLELENFLIPQRNTFYTTRIISSYLNDKTRKIRLMVPELIHSDV